jgi:predicted RNA methylase
LNFPILHPEIQDFINANLKTSITKLALMSNPFPLVKWTSVLEQIECRQKSETKLPHWFRTASIVFPQKISIEQTSSEITAAYKSSLIEGESIIDLTGGFGVDAFYFAKKFTSLIHCEINEELSKIVAHNFQQLGVHNVQCFADDSETVLKSMDKKFDWIYIDPSRRSDFKGKVFMLKDCTPNVPELIDHYLLFSNKILIKTAPILDITAGLQELKFVKSIHVVAVNNEVKELLWEISKENDAPTVIHTVNIRDKSVENFQFNLGSTNVFASYGLPKKYIYEPNSAIMKSGGFYEVSVQFGLDKLHANSHLYSANNLISFPGRIFKIVQIIPYQKKEMKTVLEGKKANVSTRNFPDSVEQIRKKWKILDGGDLYCFFTTDLNNNKIVLLCSKI